MSSGYAPLSTDNGANDMEHSALNTASNLMANAATLPQVETRRITFQNAGATLAGTLYLPEGHDGSPLPVVVVTGAWTTVEEQMPTVYAEEMVKRGFAAFTFDFRGWGKSGDLPQNVRFVESPSAKTSDIRAAFDTVAALPEIDATRINGLGICASAGYMVDAVSGNAQVARIGLVAPWLQNAEIVQSVYGGAEGVQSLIEMSRAAEAKGGEIIPAAGPEGARGVLMPIGGYYDDEDRGAIPAYDNKWSNAGWEGWLTYYPADHAAALTQPLAIVHSESAAIPEGTHHFLAGISGQASLRMLDHVAQFDFYDVPANVTRAADTMAEHFAAAPEGNA
ncbi:MAG: alpha/beta hydrolase [Pseudomonadota bacterium]